MSHKMNIHNYFIQNSAVEKRGWEKGEFICHEGHRMSKLFYLESGRLRVFRNLSSGQTILYRIYLPGSVIGDIEIFTGMAASCSVQCISPALTLSVPMDGLRNNIEEFSGMLFKLGSGIARKLHENSVNESINITYALEIRLAHYYLTFTDPELKADNLGQLSDWMGCSYRHLTRSQAHLLSLGAIIKTMAGYRAADMEALKSIASPLLDEEKARGLFERGD
ncbi:MAG: cyclic nucleotide-binding domain-containing protein [Spirochaetales bacterium]|nr:cyclic nucleotide-binding domain-containing protein [Spirochaetales bacterium]